MRNKSDAIANFNRLGEEWTAAKEDADRRKWLENEIFIHAYSLFENVRLKNTDFRYLEGMADVWEKDWPRFDAARGTLYGFFAKRLHDRAVDLYRREIRNPSAFSLDAPVHTDSGEDGTASLLDTRGEEDAYPALEQERVSELLALMLRFPERLHGHAANPEKLNYYRLFFTDGVSYALQQGDLDPEQIPHERELWEVLKERFLDFYLIRQCRSAAEIQDCPVKGYGELVPGRPMGREPPRPPLPNDVYLTYLNDREGKGLKSESTITNQRNAYKKLKHKILET